MSLKSRLRSLADAGGALAARVRVPGRRRPVVGLALGVFDFCHAGHVNLLRRARGNCDRLVVAVHTDAAVRDYKGVQPANSELERAAAIRALGVADLVVVGSDRVRICREHRVSRVFHGDDWDAGSYRRRWDRAIATCGVELVMLPHTPGIDSTRLRAGVPRVGWWLYSGVAEWSRSHIFDHLAAVYREVGGVWFVSRTGRDLVRTMFPDAPCALLPDGRPAAAAVASVEHYDLDVIVTAHFNHDAMAEVLGELARPLSLVVLSHGRSGKPGTSADFALRRDGLTGISGNDGSGRVTRRGALTVHDWSFARDTYLHCDDFLRAGGSFENPVPPGRPRVLLLPTWGPQADERGLLASRRWRTALRELGGVSDLLLSPHPLLPAADVRRFADEVGARLLEGRGRSFVHVPGVHAAVCDLSGVFWEALLFDTPAVLARGLQPAGWPAGLAPSREETLALVPEVDPEELPGVASSLFGARRPQQRALAEARLGRIDGGGARRVAERIRRLAADPAAGWGAGDPRRIRAL